MLGKAAGNSADHPVRLVAAKHYRRDHGVVGANNVAGLRGAAAFSRHNRLVLSPVLAVTMIVMWVDQLVVDVFFHTKTQPLDSHCHNIGSTDQNWPGNAFVENPLDGSQYRSDSPSA